MTGWTSGSPDVRDLRDEVHVWRTRLSSEEHPTEAYRGMLDDEERGRAERFRTSRLQRDFLVAHGWMRSVLARYLDETPAGIRFASAEGGKPRLAVETGSVRFNLSHSGDQALLAVAGDREVGVDVERHRPSRANDGVMRRFFSAREVAAIEALPPTERSRAFFDCWARKEACLKATGDGLSFPLQDVVVTTEPGRADILAWKGLPDPAAVWTLVGLEVGADYSAALVHAAGDVSVRFYL